MNGRMDAESATAAHAGSPADDPSGAIDKHKLAPLAGRTWVTLVVLGLVGQLAWTVENMYLNVFVYDTISTDPNVIAVLVAASAVAATLATILVGAWSDRVGRRKPFIALGYVLWGLTTATFGFVSPQAVPGVAASAQAIAAAVVAIVVLDCVMSFFGSGANDAAFNAWVTDSTVPANRGRVDGLLAVMPLLGMLIVFGVLDSLTRAGEWRLFFGIVGGVTAIVGVVSLWLVREPAHVQASSEGYLTAVIHGLRPSTIRTQPRLYVVLLAYAVVGTASQVFIPYLIIYLQRYLRIDGYALVLGTVLILASAASVLGGRVIDRIGKQRAILPATAIMVVGLVAMFWVRGMIGVMVAGTVMMSGFMLAIAAVAASVRDATPPDRVGMVQGLRMIAAVLVPMIVGPFIGAQVIVGAGETYVDLGVVKQVPTPWIFPAAALVAALVLIPLAWLRRMPELPE